MAIILFFAIARAMSEIESFWTELKKTYVMALQAEIEMMRLKKENDEDIKRFQEKSDAIIQELRHR